MGRAAGSDGKRRRGGDTAGGSAIVDVTEEEEEEDEPGFRSLAAVRLKHKANGVATAADPAGSGRAVVCVATTDDAIVLLNL